MNAQAFPRQHQDNQPGLTEQMNPQPQDTMAHYKAAEKLKGKNALITGGDSGIGRAVAIGFAKEGANVVINYLDRSESEDAETTKQLIEHEGVKCVLMPGDLGDRFFCRRLAEESIKAFGTINILVNNAAEQHPQASFTEVTDEQLEETFNTNILGMMRLTKQILPKMRAGDCIINTASVTAYKGNPKLVDYSATKGAIVSFTRALSQELAKSGIRVNSVAPGPIWTPLIPSTFEADDVAKFGSDVPMGRAGQPDEVAPAYIFLASDDATYFTGQVLHPNGGSVVNG